MTGSLGLRLRHAGPSGGQRDTVSPWQGQPAGAAWRGRPANDRGTEGRLVVPLALAWGCWLGVGGRRAVGPGVGLGHRQRRARCRRELEPPALPPLAAHRAMPSVLPEARLSAPPPREWGRSAVGAVSGASPQAAGDGALGGCELRGERGGRAVPARGGTDQATLLCGLVPRTHGWIPLLGDALPFHTRPTRPAATAGGAGATRGRNTERLLPFPQRAAGEPPAGPRRGLPGSHRGQQGRRRGWGALLSSQQTSVL